MRPIIEPSPIIECNVDNVRRGMTLNNAQWYQRKYEAMSARHEPLFLIIIPMTHDNFIQGNVRRRVMIRGLREKVLATFLQSLNNARSGHSLFMSKRQGKHATYNEQCRRLTQRKHVADDIRYTMKSSYMPQSIFPTYVREEEDTIISGCSIPHRAWRREESGPST